MEKEIQIPKVPRVNDIYRKKVFTFQADLKIFDAIRKFTLLNLSSAPVIDKDNKVVGYLSESDCIKYLSNCLYFDEPLDRTIETFMSRCICKVNIDWDIFELEDFFIKNKLKSAPILDSNNCLIGIVSRGDILIALEKYLKEREAYKLLYNVPLELQINLDLRQRTKYIIDNYRGHF